MSNKEKRKPKISVIMPVYNTSKYLNDSIDSVLNQSFDDFELILVNDASPDKKDNEICNLYKEKDSRIRYLVHKTNKGPGGARNTGIKHAQGEYIWFIDSDDLIVDKAMLFLYNTATYFHVDILESSSISFKTDHQKKILYLDSYIHSRILSGKLLTGQDFFKKALDNNEFWHSLPIRFFNADFLRSINNYYPFPEKYFFEDTAVLPILFNKAKLVYCTHFTPYLRRVREGSIMQLSLNEFKVESYIHTFNYLLKYIKSNKLDFEHPIVNLVYRMNSWIINEIESTPIAVSVENYFALYNLKQKLEQLRDVNFVKTNKLAIDKNLISRNYMGPRYNVNKRLFNGVIHIYGNNLKREWYLFNKFKILTVNQTDFFKCYTFNSFPFICIKRKIKHA